MDWGICYCPWRIVTKVCWVIQCLGFSGAVCEAHKCNKKQNRSHGISQDTSRSSLNICLKLILLQWLTFWTPVCLIQLVPKWSGSMLYNFNRIKDICVSELSYLIFQRQPGIVCFSFWPSWPNSDMLFHVLHDSRRKGQSVH